MTFGTAPQALVEYLASNWEATRSGRPDVPDVPRDGGGNGLYGEDAHRAEQGTVWVTEDRQEVAVNQSVHDLIHVYHPEQGGIDVTDKGSREQGTIEPVQIDVECTDRTDPETGERLLARDLMVGDRAGGAFPPTRTAPYPGLAGEVKYLLEDIRRGFTEWDKVSHEPNAIHLGNSNARVGFQVELEIIAMNTADA